METISPYDLAGKKHVDFKEAFNIGMGGVEGTDGSGRCLFSFISACLFYWLNND